MNATHTISEPPEVVLYLAALFLRNGLGLDALTSGLTTFPEAVGVMVGSPLASRLTYPRLGPRWTTTGALTVHDTDAAST